MQPESPLFEKRNTDRIHGEALNEAQEQELSKKTRQALEYPDAMEQSELIGLIAENEFLENLNSHLNVDNGEMVTIGRLSSLDPRAEAKLFQPHDKAESEQHPGVEFATSVIGFDVKSKFKNTDNKINNTGQLLLFKLDHGDADMTAKDLELGTNCRFGAFVREGNVQPFTMEMVPDDRYRGEVRMQLEYLDPEQDGEEHTAVRDEIRMFLQQRQQET
ncbi:hypothetical protein BRC20_01040 [Candidatus Saccharibacteria bacterium QS_8_54_8]|nr:MAG: hypothetical protein BRC20_01040 [Candidatus Saccharibacteria bacterium QS_8_54_8]